MKIKDAVKGKNPQTYKNRIGCFGDFSHVEIMPVMREIYAHNTCWMATLIIMVMLFKECFKKLSFVNIKRIIMSIYKYCIFEAKLHLQVSL